MNDSITNIKDSTNVIPSKTELEQIAQEFGVDTKDINPGDNFEATVTQIQKVKGKSVEKSISVVADKQTFRIATDNYISLQKRRIVLENQIRAVSQGYDNRTKDQINILDICLQDAITSEKNATVLIKALSKSNPICNWGTANCGVGDISMAKLLSFLDFHQAKYPSGFISYSGLNNNNRPRISVPESYRIVDEVIGNGPVTDEALMKIATITKWPIDYLMRKSVKESKVTALCRKSALIKATELIVDQMELNPIDDIPKFVNATVTNPSATTDDFYKVCSKFNIPYEKLFNIAVSNSTKKKLQNGGVRSKENVRAAIAMTPYNKRLRTHLYNLSISFMYQSGRPECFYGHLYLQRLQYETEKNERGDYAEQAANILKTRNIGKSTDAYTAYSNGKLPKAHIVARALRWSIKVFLNHLWEAMYVYYTQDMDYPKYYAVDHLGHRDIIYPAVSYEMLLNENLPDSQKNLHPMPPYAKGVIK